MFPGVFFFWVFAFFCSRSWMLRNLVFIRIFFRNAGADLKPIRATHTLSAVHSSGFSTPLLVIVGKKLPSPSMLTVRPWCRCSAITPDNCTSTDMTSPSCSELFSASCRAISALSTGFFCKALVVA